ncbi:MAG: branched-chain amino acid ABC transporter permease [Deltaproteobacteria bacterium]|nr:branched-chain amino acid ABC transporter permease [Deltaproteobacteria bacterium]
MKPLIALRSVAPLLLTGILVALVQGSLPDYWYFVLVVAGINIILAVSLNIVNGFTGQFSIGHAGFMAVGAYTAAKIVMSTRGLVSTGAGEQLVFLGALAAGMVTAAIAGFLVGMPSLRLRGDYLAIVTLGFNEIIRVIIENSEFLGQATGISGLPKLTTLAYVGMAAAITVMVAVRLLQSTHGRALLAIREDEVAAEAMGVDTTGYKVRAFVIAAALAGLAGGLLVFYLQLCTPKSFTFIKSIEVVAMIVLGGLGSVSGAFLTAAVLTILLETLRGFSEYRMVVYSLLLIFFMLGRPAGLFGTREIWDLLPRWRRKAAAGGAP